MNECGGPAPEERRASESGRRAAAADADGPDTDASVAVVDYGLGNLRSVTRGLQRAGADVTVTDDRETLHDADGVVLPGVGAFREGVENAGLLREDLRAIGESDTPLFGICLGMQMLLTTSEEADHEGQGEVRGLDLIPGENVRFRDDVTVPHMGWNDLTVRRDHPLMSGVAESSAAERQATAAPMPGDRDDRTDTVDGRYAYFVHSYYAVPEDDAAVVATADYGDPFAAVVADDSGTVFGTQFHPEKSGETGLAVLQNFVTLCVE